LFDYEKLPIIRQKLDDSFEWLKEEPEHINSIGDEQPPDERKINISKLEEIQIQIKMELPKPFLVFFRSKELQYKVRSCTDCYLDLADRAVKVKGKYEGFIIHFLSDSQWCFHWYLYLDATGKSFVITSPNAYCFNIDDNYLSAPYHKSEIDFQQEEIWFCSSSFSEFIYRFWLENEIWFSLSWDKIPLTHLQQDYVNHYLLQ
jgi:hypothetical protein